MKDGYNWERLGKDKYFCPNGNEMNLKGTQDLTDYILINSGGQ